MPDDGSRVVSIIERAQTRGARGMDWLSKLAKREKGGYQATLANALVILGNDTRTAEMLAFNDFTGSPLLMHAPPPAEDGGTLLPGPYPRMWDAADVAMVQAWLQRTWDGRFSRESAEAGMLAVAKMRCFHPVRDWLATLVWDGTERLATWLHVAFGAPADAYHEAVGTKFLVAAVRRVRQPGCKFDTMPVLEGKQGAGKSRACEALFGKALFSDSITHDLGSRDAAMNLLGVWGLELGELESLIRSEVETVKAFLSRHTDRYRPPYARAVGDFPRQGVLMGTTNADDYLRDATGNRRFWPVRCTKAEPEWVAENRDQLWAEAAQRETEGETLWLDEEGVRQDAHRQQAERLTEDVWAMPVRTWLRQNGRTTVRPAELLHDALGLPRDRQNRSSEMRVASLLRADKWKPKVTWEGGKTVRTWIAPSEGVEVPDE